MSSDDNAQVLRDTGQSSNACLHVSRTPQRLHEEVVAIFRRWITSPDGIECLASRQRNTRSFDGTCSFDGTNRLKDRSPARALPFLHYFFKKNHEWARLLLYTLQARVSTISLNSRYSRRACCAVNSVPVRGAHPLPRSMFCGPAH